MKTQPYTEPLQSGYPTTVCTTADLIQAYGKQGERRKFCNDCIDYKTCKGVKWSTCPYRKYYIEEEVKKTKNEMEKRAYKLWTDREIQELIKMCKEGYYTKDIAIKLNRNVSVIYMKIESLHKDGFRINRKRNRYDWSKYDDKIASLRKEGKTFDEISRILGIKKSSITSRSFKLKQKRR